MEKEQLSATTQNKINDIEKDPQPQAGFGRVTGVLARNVFVMRCSKEEAKPTRVVKGTPPSRFQS